MTGSGKALDDVSSAGNVNMNKKPSTPTAWTRGSTNPITQRVSGSVVQHSVKANTLTTSNSTSLPATTIPKDSNTPEKHANDRLMFLLANFKGLTAVLHTKDGERYSGIFSAIAENRYVVRMAKKLPAHNKQANGIVEELIGVGPDRTMSFDIQDVVDFAFSDVRFNKLQHRGQNGTASSFRTDVDISAGRGGRERELQPWTGDDGNNDLSLENGHVGGWDQFAAHEKLTGLQSTYDETNYTTRIDTSRQDFAERARRADKIAREIEDSITVNAHVAEERGFKPADEDGDEEAKYSGVRRDFQPLPSGGPNKYTPPARRPPTGQATIAGAPVDPAIISSTLAGPEENPPKPRASQTISTKPVDSANTKAQAVKVTTTNTSASNKYTTTTAITPNMATIAPLTSSRGEKKEGGATETVEKDVVNAFKQFTASEKMRVQEHQRTIARRDKAVKLNDLKKFAQNFKLHTEVPADLLPILARDEHKQLAIKEKAKKNAEDTKSTPPRPTAPSVAATPTDSCPAPKPTIASRNDNSLVSPLAPSERPNNQRNRPNQPSAPGPIRGVSATIPTSQTTHQRPAPGNLSQRLQNTMQQNRPHLQHMNNAPPQMHDPRVPSGPSTGIASPPGRSSRWNVAANFTPAFAPTTNASSGSSPVRGPSNQVFEPQMPKPGSFFEGRLEGRKSVIPVAERVSLQDNFNPIPTLKLEVGNGQPENQKKIQNNGGMPPSYTTKVTWEDLVPSENAKKTIADMFQAPALKPLSSPQHPVMGQVGQQFHNQLPYGQHHGPNPPQSMTPNQTPRHMIVQPHHGPGNSHHFTDPTGHAMQFSHSTSSVHPSPQVRNNYLYSQPAPQPGQYPPGMLFGTSPNSYPMPMARQPSHNSSFHIQPSQVISGQGPPAAYMNPAMPGQMFYQHPAQPFFAHPHGMPPQPQNGFPNSPARQAIIMATSNSQSGHSTPQMMTAYHQQIPGGGGPMSRHHNQYPQGPFAGGMRGTLNGGYAGPGIVPQGVVPSGVIVLQQGGVMEDGK